MGNKKTIIKRLQQAKSEGYEWAQSAIEQMDEQRKQQYTSSLSDALSWAFLWSSSKEGVEYWGDIHDELLEKDL